MKPLNRCKNSLPVGNSQERIKLRELITHIGPIPIVIPLKLFLERARLPADTFPCALRGSFVEGRKCKTSRECGSCDECETREDKEGLSSLKNEDSF